MNSELQVAARTGTTNATVDSTRRESSVRADTRVKALQYTRVAYQSLDPRRVANAASATSEAKRVNNVQSRSDNTLRVALSLEARSRSATARSSFTGEPLTNL